MEKYIIDADVLQAVVNYLAARPWKEVAGVMPKLLELEKYIAASKTDVVNESLSLKVSNEST